MILAVRIALVIITLYTGVMIYKSKEIPTSISSTVFCLSKGNKWVFTIVMWIVAFLLVAQLITVSKDNTQCLAFLTIAGVLGVGAAPVVAKDKNTFHYACAILSGVASQTLVALNKPVLLSLWSLYVAYTLFAKDVSRNLFFVEVCCVLTVFAYCLTS